LEKPVRTNVTALCGSDSVQITPPKSTMLDLARLATSLKKIGKVDARELWLLFDDGRHRLTIFKNGRVLVSGTNDEKTARALYSKYIGN
jgi:adenylyltransferase/sulfurtransferase